MFNKNEVEKYQSIAPGEELKKRVIATYEQGNAEKHSSLYKQVSVIAACIVLVIFGAVFAVGELSEVKLYANGEVVSENSVNMIENGSSSYSERNASEGAVSISLEATAYLKSEIKASQGELSVFDKKTGELLSSGKTCSVKGGVIIQWVVEKEGLNNAELSISNALNENVFEIEYNPKTEQGIIKKK